MLGNLDAEFDKQIDGLMWSSSVVRHRRGVASEENQIGADFVIHISVQTPIQKYSKDVLVQATRVEPGISMTKAARSDLLA